MTNYFSSKSVLFTVILLMMAECAVGRRLVTNYSIEYLRKNALNCRKDISKEARKVIKDWYSIGDIHNDWIENSNGKSIDLQGKELFPDLDYCHLTQIMLGVYMAEDRNGKKGVIEASGRLMLPMRYDDILCLPTQGVIKGLVGKSSPCTVDYYSTDGILLYTAQVTNTDLNNDPHSFYYDFDHEVFKYHIGSEFYYMDAVGRRLPSQHLPADGARLWRSDRENRESLARVAFSNNAYIKLANEAIAKGYHWKAWELLNMYYYFDLSGSDAIGTSVDLLYTTLALRCAYATGQYDLIVNGYSSNGYIAPWFLTYYVDTKTSGQAVPLDLTRYGRDTFAPSVMSEINMLASVCSDIYNSARNHVPGNAANWNQQISTVSQSVQQSSNNVLINFPGVLPEGVTYIPDTSGSYSSSSTDTSVPSSSTSREPVRLICRRCHGDKRIVEEHSLNGGYTLEVVMVTCPECGKSYDKTGRTHRHVICSSCNGQGYVETK